MQRSQKFRQENFLSPNFYLNLNCTFALGYLGFVLAFQRFPSHSCEILPPYLYYLPQQKESSQEFNIIISVLLDLPR